MADPELKEVPRDCDGQHPMITPGHSLASVTEKISDVTFLPVKKMPKEWFIGFAIAFMLLQLLFLGITWLLTQGTGVWGLNVPEPGVLRSLTLFGGLVSATPVP